MRVGETGIHTLMDDADGRPFLASFTVRVTSLGDAVSMTSRDVTAIAVPRRHVSD